MDDGTSVGEYCMAGTVDRREAGATRILLTARSSNERRAEHTDTVAGTRRIRESSKQPYSCGEEK